MLKIETFEIQLWNQSALAWSSALSVTIGTSQQWYNQTINNDYIDTTNERLTIQYVDTETDADGVRSNLTIDYAGLAGWNFTIELITVTHCDFGDYSAGDPEQAGNQTITVNVTAGETFDIQVYGTDTTGSVITNGYIYVNTANDWGTAMVLNTTHDTLWSDQAAGIDQQYELYFWIWIDWTGGDAAIPNGDFEFDINIKIISS